MGSAAGRGRTVTSNLRVVEVLPSRTVAVSWTEAGLVAGRVTTPVAVITLVLFDAHATVVPSRPVVGRVRLPRTSSAFTTVSAGTASATSWAVVCWALTTTSNGFVAVTDPETSFAVSVAFPSALPGAGRVTVPSGATRLGALDVQVIVEPLGPLAGRV